MNFIETLEELNKLYEEDEAAKTTEVSGVANGEAQDTDDNVEESCKKETLTEATADEISEDPEDAVDGSEEAVAVEEPKQVVLECTKCGALFAKAETDVVVDEETDLVNVDEECAFCQELAGYTIKGELVPYESTEVTDDATEEADDTTELDEGIFDKKTRQSADYNNAKHAFESAVKEATDGKYSDFSVVARGLSSSVTAALNTYKIGIKDADNHASNASTLDDKHAATCKVIAGSLDSIIKDIPKTTPSGILTRVRNTLEKLAKGNDFFDTSNIFDDLTDQYNQMRTVERKYENTTDKIEKLVYKDARNAFASAAVSSLEQAKKLILQ